MASVFLRIVAVAGALLPMAAVAADSATTSPASRKPNIIMIMADDLGKEALACYGNAINKTPNLDKMATEGMKFTDGHSQPLCAPSRVQLMSGKYNNRNYWVFGVMDKRQKTFGNYLKEAGYVTGISGKWQLYGNAGQQRKAGGRVGSKAPEVGFDEYCLWQVETLGSRYKDVTVTVSTGTEERKEQYGPDVFNNFALDFVRRHKSEPFFLYYPMVLTHGPFQPTPENSDYTTAPVKGTNDTKYFPDMAHYMDKMVGRLMDELKKQGIADNTLVIFTGDNGTDRPIVSTMDDGTTIVGGKGKSLNVGTNVPLIAHWPAVIKPGQVNDNLVDFTDMLPTFLEVAGEKVPTDAGLDGISFLPQLKGAKAPAREWVFSYYAPRINMSEVKIWAHDKHWKLYDDNRFYDISKDTMEENPLADGDLTAEGKAAKARLRGVITEKMKGERAEEMPRIEPKDKGKKGKNKDEAEDE